MKNASRSRSRPEAVTFGCAYDNNASFPAGRGVSDAFFQRLLLLKLVLVRASGFALVAGETSDAYR